MPDYNRPAILCQYANSPGPTGVVSSWTDISSYLRTDELSFTRGRSSDLDVIEASTGSLVLTNATRAFDPGTLGVRAHVRLRATWNSTTYDLFTGHILRSVPTYDARTGQALVKIQLSDVYGVYLSRETLDYSLTSIGSISAATTTLSAMSTLLQAANVGIDAARITTSGTAAATIAQVPDPISPDPAFMEIFGAIARTEQGRVYVSRSGQITLVARLVTSSYNPASPAPIVFGTGGYDYSRLEFDYSLDEYSFTRIVVQTTDNAVPLVADQVSGGTLDGIGVLTVFTWSRNSTVASGVLAHLQDYYEGIRLRVRAIEIIPERDPTTLWPVVLGLELGQRINIVHDPPGGGSDITFRGFVEQIQWSIRGNEWRVTLRCSPEPTYP